MLCTSVAGLSAAAGNGALAATHSVISGRLGLPGYTVIAVGTNGKVSVGRVRRGAFAIRRPAPSWTLQLLTSKGRYAGEVVFRTGKTRDVVGAKGAVNLGVVVYHPGQGYATLRRALAASHLLASRWAYARNGVPLGNGRNAGFVASPIKAGTPGAGPSGPGGDSDRSGVPNMFDVAWNGNQIINSLYPRIRTSRNAAIASAVRSAAPASPPAISPWMSQLFLPIDQTVNADASDVSPSGIDAAMRLHLNLKLLQIPAAGPVDLNCNGLAYCSPGGTGMANLEGLALGPGGAFQQLAFPNAMIDPVTGAGQIVGPHAPAGLLGTAGGGREFSLDPGVGASGIGSGDVISELTGAGTAQTTTPTTVDFVFTTVPAIASYADTAGDTGSIAYPDTSRVGTQANPIRIAPGTDGDVTLTFSVYRPQRAGIVGAREPAFMDIGHLWYAFDSVQNAGPTPGMVTPPQCSVQSYSNPSASLSVIDGGQAAGSGAFGSPPGTGMLVDSASDLSAASTNTIQFTVDISACMAQKGQAFPVGQPVMFDISANSQSSSDHANQTFWIERTR